MLVGAAALLLLADHRGHPAPWRTLWAEDGGYFLDCQTNDGLAACLFREHDGYLHAIPRLAALLITALPVERWAIAAAAVSLLLVAASLAATYTVARWLIPSAAVRAGAVFVVASSAALHTEVVANLTNAHWILTVSGVLIATNPEASRHPAVGPLRAAWLALICLSDALAPLVLLALVLGAVLRRRRHGTWLRSDGAALVLAAIAVGTQIVITVLHPRPVPPRVRPGPGQVLGDYVTTVGHDSWAGPGQASTLVLGGGAVVLAAVLLVVVVSRISGGPAPGGRLPIPLLGGAALLVLSVAHFAASEVVNRVVVPRYEAAPFLLVVLGGAAVMSGAVSLAPVGRVARAGLPIAAVLGSAVLLVLGPVMTQTASGPTLAWRSEIRDARQQCRRDPAATPVLAIAPYTGPVQRWYVRLPCAQL